MSNLDKILGLNHIPNFESSISKMAKSNALFGLNEKTNVLRKMVEANNVASMFSKQSSSFKVLGNILNTKDITNSFNINKGALDYILNTPSIVEAQKQSNLMRAILGTGGTLNYITAVDAARKENNVMNAVLGGSTLNYITKMSQAEYKNNDIYKALGALGGIHNAVTKHLDTYNHQLKLSEQLAKTFSAFVPQKNPLFDAFTSTNFIENKKLSTFDVVSGASFFNTLAKYDVDEKRINEIYAEAQTALANNTKLQEEVTKFQATVVAIQKGSTHVQDVEKWYKFKRIEDYIEWFMNKILIRKLGLSHNVANIIINLLIIFSVVAVDIFIEAKGADIYNYIMGNEKEKTKTDTVTIYKYIQQPKETTDFTIDKTPIYLRSSVKTKRIGYIKINTTLSIIKIKNGWCFVEALTTITKPDTNKNRKKYKTKNSPIETQQTVKGWVEKKYLDMFQ